MPVRCQGSPIPWTNRVTRGNCSTRSKDPELPAKTDLPENQERPTALHWLRKLLSELYPQALRKDSPVPRSHQSRKTYQDHKRDHGQFYQHQQILRQRVRLMAQTTHAQLTVRAHDRRQLQECGLRPHDRGECRRKDHFNQENLCTSGIWFQNVFAVTDKNVHICERIPGHLLRLRGVEPHSLGINQTGCRPHGQQICDAIFPDENHPTSLVERVRFRPPIPFHHCSCTGQNEHSRGFSVPP